MPLLSVICFGGGKILRAALETIVMVDDDLDDIYMTRRRLSESNIEKDFIFEKDAKRLFKTLSDVCAGNSGNSNIIILLDMNMPAMNGVEVLQELKAHRDYMDIPVLMLCGSDDTEDMVVSYGSGADGYLTKPIDPDEMLGFVGTLIADEERIAC